VSQGTGGATSLVLYSSYGSGIRWHEPIGVSAVGTMPAI
jgi:hypothetical protein